MISGEKYTQKKINWPLKKYWRNGNKTKGTNRAVVEQDDNYRKIIDNILRIAVDFAALSFIGTVVWIVVMGIDIIFR